MKKYQLKLIVRVCLLFIAVGLLIYLPLSAYLPRKITDQILKRDLIIARYIALQIREPLLTGDKLALFLLLYDNLGKFTDAEYMFIQNEQKKIIAHTFGKEFPVDLINISSGEENLYPITRLSADKREIYDLSVPILEGGEDRLHLGISLKSGKAEIAELSRINYYVAGAIFAGLGFGFILLLVLGVREARKLSSLEEKNKLALELHGGLAQSLVNVVVRLELCQKLFDKDPKGAMDELSKLRDNARELVKDARQAINNLRGFYK